MLTIKYLILIILLLSSSYVGIAYSKKFQNRVIELKEMKSLLNIFLTKIKLTYEPIPKIFEELGNLGKSNINSLFKIASKYMENISAGESWKKALQTQNTNLNKEDLGVIENLSNLLGKVDVDGQISEIELVDSFLETQLKKAEQECAKNTKMYKTLGIVIGLVIVIILI